MADTQAGGMSLSNAMIARMLAEGTSTAPVQHWTQGAGRIAQALLGGYQLAEQQRQSRDAIAEELKLYGGGGAAPSLPMPSAGTMPPGGAPPAPAMANALAQSRPPAMTADNAEATTPQGRINNAFGATPQDRDIATRTVLGEASNEGQRGMNAVADVIRNRAANGGYGGNTMGAVSRAPGQFEPWMTQQGRDRMEREMSGPQATNAMNAVDSAGVGSRPDVTGGAQYFYSPRAQAQLAPQDGRPVVPSFARGREPTTVIGGHNYYAGMGQGAPQGQAPQQPAGPQMAQPQMPQPPGGGLQMPPQIRAALSSGNPVVQQNAMALWNQIKAKNLAAAPTGDITEYEYARRQGFNGSLQEWIKAKEGGRNGEYSMNPIWGTGPDGRPTVIQLGRGGTAIESRLPPGIQVGKDVIKVDAGTHTILLDPVTRQPISQVPKNIAEAAAQGVVGKDRGEAQALLESMNSRMPGLETVVKELDDLAGKATYTVGGQAFDTARRQLNLSPREGAIARQRYIAMVDNQILPLLRDTFGAQFTQREGETLRGTLGDPNKSPAEKQAILKSFIEQKRRDIQGLVSRGSPVSPPAAAPPRGNAATGSPPSIDDLIRRYQ